MNRGRLRGAVLALCAALVAGCAMQRLPPGEEPASPSQARARIDSSLPPGVGDRAGWVEDIYSGLTVQGLAPTRQNVCAVAAVIEQESNFKVNPVVPGLGTIAWREIDRRAEHAGLPRLVVHGALDLHSADGRTYAQRIDAAHTEKDLSDIYEDFVGRVPLGRTLFAGWNPIRTRGPMQVNVAFADQYAAVRPYPYPLQTPTLADELFTRRGSVYFGIAHLLGYQPPYDDYLYRFADFNAGQYASRNAAFQSALSSASGVRLVSDGALLSHESTAAGAGETEVALRAIAGRLGVDERQIHDAFQQGRSADFERTTVYLRVFALAERRVGHPLPRAVLPVIKLEGPKISRSLTTAWYARRVDGRYEHCLGR